MGKELRELWDSLPNKAALGVLLVAWIAVFHFLGNAVFGYMNTPSLWVWLNTIYENAAAAGPEQGNTADDALGRWIPLLVLALFWVKRQELIDAPKVPWAPALAILAMGAGLHAIGYIVQQTRLSVVGFIVGTYGLIGLVWGHRFLKTAFFPYCLFLFCIPLASVLPTSQLRLIVASVSTGLCEWLLNLKLVREGTMIFNQKRTFHFDVAPACSGIRSLTVIVLLATCYAFLNLSVWWRRAIVIAASVPIAVLGNILRLSVVIWVGESLGQKQALIIETKFGFLTFLFALVCVFALGSLLNEQRQFRLRLPTPKADASSPAAPTQPVSE